MSLHVFLSHWLNCIEQLSLYEPGIRKPGNIGRNWERLLPENNLQNSEFYLILYLLKQFVILKLIDFGVCVPQNDQKQYFTFC